MKKIGQKILILSLVSVIMLNPLFGFVRKSQAQLSSGQVTGKAIAAGISCFVAIKIEQYAKTLTDEAAGASGNSAGNIVGGVASAVTSVPTNDQVTRTTANQSIRSSSEKQKTSTAIDMAKRCVRDTVVKIYMDWIVDQTITWIQGGGKPQFVQNWNGFLQDAVNAGVGETVRESNAAFLCSPFKLQVKISLFPVQRFKQKVDCTLDKIVGNIDNFMADFQNGSWVGYAGLWQPNNNYFGQILLTYDEAAKRSSEKKEAAQNEAIAGGGFLSSKRCIQKDQQEVNGCLAQCMDDPYACGVPENTSVQVFCESQASCSKYEATTPGSVIAGVVTKGMTSDMDFINNVQSWTAAIANAAINRLITNGLSYMTGTNAQSIGTSADTYGGADFAVNNAGNSTNSSANAAATDQLLEDTKGLKINITNNEQAIYDIKNKSYLTMKLTHGIYTSCNGVSTAVDLANISSLMAEATSTAETINNSYLKPNSGFQIAVNNLLSQFARTDLTSADLQNKYSNFTELYRTEIRDVNSGNGKTNANEQLTAARGVLDAARTKANPPIAPPALVSNPPDPTVTDPTSNCGKAYSDSSVTP